MKLTIVALLAVTSPALALEHPSGEKNRDRRVCDVVYDPNDIVEATAPAGAEITIVFRASEQISDVAASDTAHLKWAITKGSNVLWLKATEAMPPQPLSVRTLQEDGTPRDYPLQWTAFKPTAPPNVALASTGIAEVTPDQPPCYVIRYQYPMDEKAARDKAARAAWAKRKTDEQEIALRKQQMDAMHNVRYVAMGDASIAPTEIFDDGYTTQLRFPGNLRIPVILTVAGDGKESEVTGITAEDNGVVKLHGVMPMLRLREGNLVLCIFNRAYNPIGADPGTGTTSPTIDRTVKTR
jgi:type IV secretion system protein VirB9